MKYDNKISYKAYGKYALFSDPILRVGGEKCSYSVPTYQSLIGITDAIYWKPTFKWVIDRVRVMKPIQTQSKSVKPMRYNDSASNDLSIYTYLYDVEYQVEAHFEWNLDRPDLEKDRNEHKHYVIANTMIERGGKRDVFLGARECVAYAEPCVFGEGAGAYDDREEVDFGVMFHGFDYPPNEKQQELFARLSRIVMKRGVIEFERPEACVLPKKKIKKYAYKKVETKGNDPEDLKAVEREGAL